MFGPFPVGGKSGSDSNEKWIKNKELQTLTGNDLLYRTDNETKSWLSGSTSYVRKIHRREKGVRI